MRARELEGIRQELIERLTAIYRAVHGDVREEMLRTVSGYDQDQPRDEADDAQFTEIRDLRLSLAEADAARAQQIEQALARIQAGTYGKCIDCGNPIESKRLKLIPWTLRCVECQEDMEFDGAQRSPSL